MLKKSNGQDSRQKILDAALNVFYEAGFDGARVDVIARRAGVNQALIYYYFKSKEELFAELININIEETIIKKRNLIGEKNILDADVTKEVCNKMMDFLVGKEKIFSIVLGEILKNSHNKNIEKGFEFLLPVVKDSRDRLLSSGTEPEIVERALIAGIFFGASPIITYIALGEKLADYYGLDKEYMKETFMSLLNIYAENLIEYLKGDLE